jgi:transcriptional repressor NrdR
MHCPFCSHTDTKVVDSRVNELEVRRRRECEKCDKRFTTYENAEIEITVLKKDGQHEAFLADKVRNGIIKSCHKRPVTPEQVEEIVAKIEKKVRNLGKWEVKSDVIGRLVMKELLKLDKVAYIRFASVCKSFDDPALFEKELSLIQD